MSARIGGAVVFVRNAARSRDFYRDVLGLDVELDAADATLLAGDGGTKLALRELPRAPRVMGGIGVQYVAWVVADAEALEHAQQALTTRGDLINSSTDNGVTVVEGRDPDGIRVVIVHPEMPGAGISELPDRLYAY